MKFYLIEGFARPVTCLDTVRFWQSQGREISELVPVKMREISEGSGK